MAKFSEAKNASNDALLGGALSHARAAVSVLNDEELDDKLAIAPAITSLAYSFLVIAAAISKTQGGAE